MTALLVCFVLGLLGPTTRIKADENNPVNLLKAELFSHQVEQLQPDEVHARLIQLYQSRELIDKEEQLLVSKLLDVHDHSSNQCTKQRASYLNSYANLPPRKLNTNLMRYINKCKMTVFNLCIKLEAKRVQEIVADFPESYSDDMMFIKGELRQLHKSYNMIHMHIPRRSLNKVLLAYLQHKVGNLKTRTLLDETKGPQKFRELFRAHLVPMCETIRLKLEDVMELVLAWDEKNEMTDTMDGNLMDWLTDYHICGAILRDTKLMAEEIYGDFYKNVNWATKIAVKSFGEQKKTINVISLV